MEFEQWTVPPSGEVTWSERLSEFGVCLGLGVLGFSTYVGWLLVFQLALLSVEGDPTDAQLSMLGPPAIALGFATAAGLYFSWSRYDGSYVDVATPDLRGWLTVGGGFAVLLGIVYAAGLLFERLGVPQPEHSTVETIASADPLIILYFVAVSVLLIGPAEEFLFRNLIQKRLAETLSPVGAVSVASVVFAVAHVFSYFSWDPVQLVASLATVLVLSLVLGALFHWRRNLVEVALVHGCYNGVQFLALYLERVGSAPWG